MQLCMVVLLTIYSIYSGKYIIIRNIMFKKGDVVIYPNHGKGLIKSIHKEDDNTVYYEIVCEENLELLVPIESAELLGMRHPLKKNSLIKILTSVNKVVIDGEDLQNVEKVARGLFSKGRFEDTVYLIKLLKRLKKDRSKVNKKLELSQKHHLEQARFLLRSEALHVLGEKGYEKYSF